MIKKTKIRPTRAERVAANAARRQAKKEKQHDILLQKSLLQKSLAEPQSKCVFCEIATGAIPVTIIAQNEYAVAFPDRAPQAPTHILIIPREHIININDLGRYRDVSGSAATDCIVAGMIDLVQQIAQIHGNPSDKGFKLMVNTGASAGQVVFHMHWHFLAGK